ncbi:hypothetical protein E0500_025005 [Streptomyces sp. KM273126]|uniref:hypothetical protein n=1 Tax=Streptomyces sp. KM273126 TaxID=2545247 RepID=UPI00103BAC4C|nr:hypothetical protein [Streptomyces sp. KM273126]MBA2810565.1 hypothetical protein [Streptomyces sp. KM273126]
MSSLDTPVTPNPQPEPTLLARRRTCLAFRLASVVAARFTAREVGITAVALGPHRSDTSGRGSLPLACGPAPVLGVGGAAHLLFGAVG